MRVIILLFFAAFSFQAKALTHIDELINELRVNQIARHFTDVYLKKLKSDSIINPVLYPCVEGILQDQGNINSIVYDVYSEIFTNDEAEEMVRYLRSDLGKRLTDLTFKRISLESFNASLTREDKELMNHINSKYFNQENKRKQQQKFRDKSRELLSEGLEKCAING